MKIGKKEKTTSPSSKKTSDSSSALSHANSALLVDIDQLSVSFSGRVALADVSFCVHGGEFIGLVGPNGAGKTTLLRALLGVGQVTSGSIKWFGSRRVGYVPQRGIAQEQQVPISAMEVVQMTAPTERAAQEALQQVGLEAQSGSRFAELSGGQQQRVLIARAIASKAKILILDEPTTGIDEYAQSQFYTLLETLKAAGIAILMVSHDIEAVLRLTTRVICLNQTIVYDGPPAHFDPDTLLPSLYGSRHRLLHHDGGHHA